MKLLQNVFRSWQTTAVAVLGFIGIVWSPLQEWVQATTTLTPERWLALIVLIIGALAKDANKTGIAR